MTTPPEPRPDHPNGPADPVDPLSLTELIATGLVDVVPGDPPVPISVWRIAPDADWIADPVRFTPRLASLLVGLYTHLGDTIVDLTADPALAGAAGAGARPYVALDHPTRAGDLTRRPHLTGAVRLVVLRWPNPHHRDPDGNGSRPSGDATRLLTACRRLLVADGYTIAALIPPDGGHYIDHARHLIPAADNAGLGYLQHIIALTTHLTDPPDPSDEPPSEAGEHADTAERSRDIDRHIPAHLDLLVFVLHRARHA